MMPRRFSDTVAIGLVIVYCGLLCFRYDRVPGGVCNDAIQEVQTGFNAVWRDGLPVMAFDPSTNGVETLWVGIAGVLVAILGHDTLAAVMSSWLAVALLLFSLYRLARQHRECLDPVIVILVAMTMPWLFHYGRSALRGISSATFLAASLAAISYFLSHPRGWRGPVALGAALALGIYTYTTSRIPPLVYVMFALGHITSAADFRRAWFIQHLRTVAVATVISIPNILYAAYNPFLFFFRGVYGFQNSAADRLKNVLESLAVPLWYRSDTYKTVVGLIDGRVDWVFDAAAVILPRAGISPVPLIIGLAALTGMILAQIHRRRIGRLYGVLVFATGTYIATAVLIGFMGPSLTRLSIMIPAVVLLASLPLSMLARKFNRAGRAVVIFLLVILSAGNIHAYFQRTPQTRWACTSFSAMSAARVASRIAGQGKQALLIVSRDLNAARYYSFNHSQRVIVSEFHQRPFDPAELKPEMTKIDAIVVSLDPVDRLHNHSPQMRAAALYYSGRYRVIESGEDPPYIVFDTGRSK